MRWQTFLVKLIFTQLVYQLMFRAYRATVPIRLHAQVLSHLVSLLQGRKHLLEEE
jgi:hypothetical protein